MYMKQYSIVLFSFFHIAIGDLFDQTTDFLIAWYLTAD